MRLLNRWTTDHSSTRLHTLPGSHLTYAVIYPIVVMLGCRCMQLSVCIWRTWIGTVHDPAFVLGSGLIWSTLKRVGCTWDCLLGCSWIWGCSFAIWVWVFYGGLGWYIIWCMESMKLIGGYIFDDGLEGDNQVTNRHHWKAKSTCLLWVEYTWLCS
jgi:hypothetical protein